MFAAQKQDQPKNSASTSWTWPRALGEPEVAHGRSHAVTAWRRGDVALMLCLYCGVRSYEHFQQLMDVDRALPTRRLRSMGASVSVAHARDFLPLCRWWRCADESCDGQAWEEFPPRLPDVISLRRREAGASGVRWLDRLGPHTRWRVRLAVRGSLVAVGRRARDETVDRGVGWPVEQGWLRTVGCNAGLSGWTSTSIRSTTRRGP